MDYARLILDKTKDGLEVFNFFMPIQFREKKMFKNPFYQDTKASCHIYYEPRVRQYYMKDHGDPAYSGNCFWLVGMLHKVDTKKNFMEVVRIINRQMDLGLDVREPKTNIATIPMPSRRKPLPRVKDEHKGKPISCNKRKMTDDELAFWGRYGITASVLNRYNVSAIHSYTGVGENGSYKIYSTRERMIFGYFDEKFVKIYRPMDKCRFQYGGDKPSDYCFGLKQLPTCDDTVFITGGEKDVLSLAAHGFNAVCFNSETGDLPPNIMHLLQGRFQHIIIMYDCDETGVKAMERQVEKWSDIGLLPLLLPLSGDKTEKDISDFFLKGKKKEDLQVLVDEAIATTYADTLALIKACEVDLRHPARESVCIISVNDIPVASCDNIMCVAGGEGTGKSNFVSSLMSGALLSETPTMPIDTLGFNIRINTEKKAVIHFDTEQSEQQLQKNASMMITRAGLESDDIPSFYHPMYLTTLLKREDRMRVIRDSMSLFHRKHGGIYMVVIDGIADLVRSANDETSSIEVIEELYKLASAYHTLMICVLHYVPGGIKLRGHLGSELQRKAATILSVEKDENPNYSVVKAMKLRDGNPLEVPMQQFSWSKEKNMFMFVGSKSESAMASRKQEHLAQIVQEVFREGNEQYTHTDLAKTIVETDDVSERTAKTYISELYKSKVIVKQGDKYVLNPQKPQPHGQ